MSYAFLESRKVCQNNSLWSGNEAVVETTVTLSIAHISFRKLYDLLFMHICFVGTYIA